MKKLFHLNNRKTYAIIDKDGNLVDTYRVKATANKYKKKGEKIILYEEYLKLIQLEGGTKNNGINN